MRGQCPPSQFMLFSNTRKRNSTHFINSNQCHAIQKIVFSSVQIDATASQRPPFTGFLAKMKPINLRNTEKTALFGPTGGETGQRANPTKKTRHGATWGQTRQAGLSRQAVPEKNEPRTFFPDIGSLAETRSLLRSRFFAAGFARICLNLRVRPKKPGGRAKKKRPGVFS